MREDFAVFILSNGRPNKVHTVSTLINQGYTGKYFIILDNEDSTIDEYTLKFGEEHILVFDKSKVANTFDMLDNFKSNKVVVYARNVCFDIAKRLNLNYFLELEDDYTRFEIREESNKKLLTFKILDLDSVFNLMIDYLNESDALTIAFSQGGDMIGGVDGNMWRNKIKRKAMNSFFCRVDKPFTFIGRMNDDVNTYTTLGAVGKLFMTIANIDLIQVQTQKDSGGNSQAYLEYGTYLKSWYSVMCMPSAVKIDMMGDKHYRIHHIIDWETCVPKIISERFRNNG